MCSSTLCMQYITYSFYQYTIYTLDAPEITLRALSVELKTLTEPILFGIGLGIAQHVLDVIQMDHKHGIWLPVVHISN